MSNTEHKYPRNEDITLEITAVALRDRLDARENLNIRLSDPTDHNDKKGELYLRMNTIVEKLNGAYSAVCSGSPKFRLATAKQNAKQVRRTIHKAFRNMPDGQSDPWDMVGTLCRCRVVEGNPNPKKPGEFYADTVYINEILNENISEEEYDALLDATDFFQPKTDETESSPEEAEIAELL